MLVRSLVVGLSVVFEPGGCGERLPDVGERRGLRLGHLVAFERAAVGVQDVGLVEFPDLEAQGVLDSVSALLTEAVRPHVTVLDQDNAEAAR
jgi:hypothetical protein